MSEHTKQPCGCFVSTDVFHEPTIEWCSLHEAAPELLEALKDMLAQRGHPGDRNDRARAAIAKASPQESEVGK